MKWGNWSRVDYTWRLGDDRESDSYEETRRKNGQTDRDDTRSCQLRGKKQCLSGKMGGIWSSSVEEGGTG